MIGEKDVALPGGGVSVSDASQGKGAFLGFGAREPDSLVREQALSFIDLVVLQHLIPGVLLLTGDEEDFLGRELAIPGVIGVAQVLHHDGTLGKVQGASLFDLMLSGRSDGHKGRQVAAMIQEGMQLEAPALVRRKEAQGKSVRHRLTTVASRL